MERQTLSRSRLNINLWLLLSKVRHLIFLARQRELSQYNIPISHTFILRAILDLGPKVTILEVARIAERKISVISRQTAIMEKDGLIKRIKDKPKSNLLRLELTEKGLAMAETSKESKLIDFLFSSLSINDCQQMESSLNRILIKLKEYASD